jgi:hypothetical protein
MPLERVIIEHERFVYLYGIKENTNGEIVGKGVRNEGGCASPCRTQHIRDERSRRRKHAGTTAPYLELCSTMGGLFIGRCTQPFSPCPSHFKFIHLTPPIDHSLIDRMASSDVRTWGNVGFLLFPGFEVLDVYGEELGLRLSLGRRIH